MGPGEELALSPALDQQVVEGLVHLGVDLLGVHCPNGVHRVHPLPVEEDGRRHEVRVFLDDLSG